MSAAIACIRPRRSDPPGPVISVLSRDTVLSPTDRLPNRLAVRSAETKPLAAATPPGVDTPATLMVPVPGSNPAMERTSSRAPEPSTPTNAAISPAGTLRSTSWNSPPRCDQPLNSMTGGACALRAARLRAWTGPPSAITTSSRAIASWVSESPSSVRDALPSSTTTTRSAWRTSSASRWLTRMTIRPASASACILRKRSFDSSSVSAELGSSNRNTRACWTRARAISVRWWMASGTSSSRRSRTSSMPRSPMTASSRAFRSRRSQRVRSRPTMTLSATVRLGNSWGSWWTTATRCTPMSTDQCSSSTRISPASGVVSAARILTMVLLPAPFGPATPRIWPG